MQRELAYVLYTYFVFRVVFGQTSIRRSPQITPRCGSQLISIEVNFDPVILPEGKFTDWIIVGISGKPECRLRGNGEVKYIIEISVFNDPCLTQIPAQNIFQNGIRIGKNPSIILEDDQSVTVKCIYGLPSVETVELPVINSNFNIENSKSVSTKFDNFNMAFPNRQNSLLKEVKSSMNVDEAIQDTFPATLRTNEIHEEMTGKKSALLENMVNLDSRAEKLNSTSSQSVMSSVFSDRSQISIKTSGLDSKITKKKSFTQIFSMIIILVLIVFFFFALLLFCYKKNIFTGKRFSIRRSLGPENISEINAAYKLTLPFKTKSTIPLEKQMHNNLNSKKRELDSEKTEQLHSTAAFSNEGFHENKEILYKRDLHLRTTTKNDSAKLPVLPLKSNLEEFVSKTYALGEYNSAAIFKFTNTCETYNEAKLNVEKKKTINQEQSDLPKNENGAISSCFSTTEIVHAAETARGLQDFRKNWTANDFQKLLCDCVFSIRGFGYRKLTEQEIIRWQNLINYDPKIQKALLMSKSSTEIENIFEGEEYKNMFSLSKWHEISLCVHRALTEDLDCYNSKMDLQLFVGNVESDW